MTATYTWDVFSTLDAYGSYGAGRRLGRPLGATSTTSPVRTSTRGSSPSSRLTAATSRTGAVPTDLMDRVDEGLRLVLSL
jgi:hypothetical protein